MQRGLTQEEVARIAEITRSYLSDIEGDKAPRISVDVLVKLLHALGLEEFAVDGVTVRRPAAGELTEQEIDYERARRMLVRIETDVADLRRSLGIEAPELLPIPTSQPQRVVARPSREEMERDLRQLSREELGQMMARLMFEPNRLADPVRERGGAETTLPQREPSTPQARPRKTRRRKQ